MTRPPHTPELDTAPVGTVLPHDGMATLKQVVEFYNRGGNFPVTNQQNLETASSSRWFGTYVRLPERPSPLTVTDMSGYGSPRS